ncbi:cyclic nucleotide-binding domain protein (macronuclear) [Tetrahymena thermophila SB210]|uniref:Cyclic nucleotide-binding domain protein n=1 Tax=Tetrahymena thermophila (strain SB210) TaxID=312017 RepID=Q244Z2_TETTS|nr:cyclic nucleotide-binding domain protein [Tetrahymena thermophila SB210]EAS03345.1 cyclic nucleotide-binding domain protein [Tetrahymena thermophila SB210]|eukprot:XP_001023590.1 cyclic nucleotide-binding domain protein [Tetrahymena thermophila SB210]
METTQQIQNVQTKQVESIQKLIIPKIDISGLSLDHSKSQQIQKNLRQKSDSSQNKSPLSNTLSKNDDLKKRLLKYPSNDLISKNELQNSQIHSNFENDISGSQTQSPLDVKKSGCNLLKDQIIEQKRHNIKEQIIRQLTQQQQVVSEKYSKNNSVQDSNDGNQDISPKALNLNQFLLRKDQYIEQKRNQVKQKLAEIGLEETKKNLVQNIKRQKLFQNKQRQNESIKINNIDIKSNMSNRNAQIKLGIGKITQSRNSSMMENSKLLSVNNTSINTLKKQSISLNGSLEDQFDQEQNKLKKTTKEIYFSSVIDPIVGSQSESTQNCNQIPIRKRIPNITADPYMNQALGILMNKTKEQRNGEDIQNIMRATKQIPFFNKIESKVLLFQSLCKAMQYQYIPKGGIVFFYGDFPDRFYITLKGKVSILIPKKPEEIHKEDQVAKELKSTQQLIYTIHKRLLYRSLHRAYKRLCNILYFVLIVKVKANILQKIPTQQNFTKSRIDFTLNSLAEEGENLESEDDSQESLTELNNNSIVIQNTQSKEQLRQKSKVELGQVNIEKELDKAMQIIRSQNSEKKIMFKQMHAQRSSQKIDTSKAKNSFMDLSQSSYRNIQVNNQDQKQSILNTQRSSNLNNSVNIDRKQVQFEVNNSIEQNVQRVYSIPQNSARGQNSDRGQIDPNLIEANTNNFTMQNQQIKKKYQPILPAQSYYEINNYQNQNFKKDQQIQSYQVSILQEDSSYSVLQKNQNDIYNHHDQEKFEEKEFRQPVEKFKDLLINKMVQDESSDPMYNSNQLYIAKLDKDMKEIRRPSQLNINLAPQVENVQLAQKLQNISHKVGRRRSVLKGAIDAFVTNSSSSSTYKMYQEQKKVIEQQIKGLDLEKLENGAHFFVNNTFKYNHAFTSGDGLVFGELGILNKKPRAATIICLEDCYFGYLSSQNYQQILMKKEKASLVKKREFIESTLIQNMLSGEKMSKISYYFHKRKYQNGEIVFKEGDATKYVYLVKKGEIELQKEIEITQNEQESTKIVIRVAKLSSREYFGDCDIYFNRNRKFTAIVTQQSTLYYCEKNQFIKQLEEMKQFYEKYAERIKTKEEYRNQQIEECKRTRNYDKNLTKLTSPKKKNKRSVNHLQIEQQKMDAIICGVPYNQQNDGENVNSNSPEQNYYFHKQQFIPKLNDENETEGNTSDRLLMVKSSFQTHHQKSPTTIKDTKYELIKNLQKVQLYNQIQNLSKTSQHSESSKQFFTPVRDKQQNNIQGENAGYLSARYQNQDQKSQRQDQPTLNTERLQQYRVQSGVKSKSSANLIDQQLRNLDQIKDTQNQDDKIVNKMYTASDQITSRSVQNQNNNNIQTNNGLITNRSQLNSQLQSNRTISIFEQQMNDFAMQDQAKKQRIAGQIVQNMQQDTILQENLQKEQLQELKEEFFSGFEILKKLKKDIKINKELLKKGTKHQKKISAHEQYKITKEVCMYNDDFYQRGQRVNQNKNKITQLEIETGTRKQIHHQKRGSQICSIYSKLSSMEDRATFQNSHGLEPEVVVQSPIISRKNSGHEFNFSQRSIYNKDSLVQSLSTTAQEVKKVQLNQGKDTKLHLIQDILSKQQFQQNINNNNNYSQNLLPQLGLALDQKRNLKRVNSSMNFTSNNQQNQLIKTSKYFLLQDKSQRGNLNIESQSRGTSRLRNQQIESQQNEELNKSVGDNLNQMQKLKKPNSQQSSIKTVKSSPHNFFPIHSEKLFSSNGFKNNNNQNQIAVNNNNNNNNIQQNVINKLNLKDNTASFKNISIYSKTLSNFKSPQQLQNKGLFKCVKPQQNKQNEPDQQVDSIGQQLCFDDNQVQKVPIKRFDIKKNYLTANKITILNHMQKPIFIKNE